MSCVVSGFLGVAKRREHDPRHLTPESVMLRRHGPRLDLLKLNRRVEDVDRRVDVVEVDDELAELVLGVLDPAGYFGSFRHQACKDVGVCHRASAGYAAFSPRENVSFPG